MTEEKLEKIYRSLKIIIYTIPVIALVAGFYLILFPVDSYDYFPGNPELSKFVINKNSALNQFLFGVSPVRDYRFIDLTMALEKISGKCPSGSQVSLEKTYRAFQYSTANPISDEEQLKNLLFRNNKTQYPNGSLLHLKPTNEVFVITNGKKLLFPGPEIFQAFGYSFDNLIDVDQSEIDLFPDAEQKVFSWSIAHPDGTIFISFASHSLYIISEGKKIPISSEDLLKNIWPQYHAIAASDPEENNKISCNIGNLDKKIRCRFDTQNMSGIGRFYSLAIEFPAECSMNEIEPGRSTIRFVSDHTWSTAKESLHTIAASVFNRYFFKQ